MIDLDSQISAVSRSLGTKTLEAGEARVQTISQTYPSPVADVWEALTTPERIERWFMPVTGDLKLGGRYQLEGNAGGEVLTCNEPESFTATWEFGGMTSWIEVRLTAAGEDSTLFTLEHVAHVDDELWAQFGPGATGVGWDGALLGLSMHLASGVPVDRDAVQEWSVSEDGKRFTVLSSEAWRDASVAAGTDPAEANAAADRTTEAYTAAPE